MFFVRAGAFIPAVPVQPVVFRYPNKLVSLFMTILVTQLNGTIVSSATPITLLYISFTQSTKYLFDIKMISYHITPVFFTG